MLLIFFWLSNDIPEILTEEQELDQHARQLSIEGDESS
jgi:hypothetical protein